MRTSESSETGSEQQAHRGGRPSWWSYGCLVLVLLLAAGLRLWNLGGQEYGNLYYAAAVRSMASTASNFFARNVIVQIATWVIAALLAAGATGLRGALWTRDIGHR